MQAIVVLLFFVMGASVDAWKGQEYPNQQWPVPQGRPFHWRHDRNFYHPHRFPYWYPQQSQQQEDMEIEKSLAEAEWICRNPKTGDVLIVAPQTVDETKKPFDESTRSPEQEQVQDTSYPVNTKYPSVQTTTENSQTDTPYHGGEGLIDARFGGP